MTRGETGKQRNTRIELTYYRRPDSISRLRAALVVLAIVMAGLWFAIAPILDKKSSRPIRLFEWNRLASPGYLSRVHSTWESSCETCHVPFQPMNASHRSPLSSADGRQSNERCQACHAGPTHHASQIPRELACSVCHQDHRGPEASLVRLDDASCTICHAGLNGHRDINALALRPPVANSVIRFDANPDHHPEFHVVQTKSDPGRLKFNHALHRSPGYTLAPGGNILTFAGVEPAERPRYGWNPTLSLDSVVPPLEDCNVCHRLDTDRSVAYGAGSTPADRVLKATASGAYMFPVTFDHDCRACHPLAFDSRDPTLRLPHGLPPGGVLDWLVTFYQAQVVRGDQELLRGYVAPRRKPGEPASPVVEQIGRAVDLKVMTALRRLFGSSASDEEMRKHDLPLARGGCALCHHFSPAPAVLIRPEAIRDVAIEPVNVPVVWFERARFDHSAHRAVQCESCHSEARTSKTSADLLLPGIGQCVKCHGPAAGRGDDASGGAGDSCTECHRFHNGDQSRHVERRTIDKFRRGSNTVP